MGARVERAERTATGAAAASSGTGSGGGRAAFTWPVIAEEVGFASPAGRFSIHSRRIANYQELVRFALRHVPPAAVESAG